MRVSGKGGAAVGGKTFMRVGLAGGLGGEGMLRVCWGEWHVSLEGA